MGLFDKLFNSSKQNYFDPDEITKSYNNQIQKRFSAGKADQRLDNTFIEVGADNDNKDNPQRSTINREYFLRKKNRLRGYAEDLLVQAIIRTRTSQIIQFAVPTRYSSDGNGFEIVVKGKKKSEMTKHEINIANKLEDFIYRTGARNSGLDWRDNFPEFLSKVLYDFYVYDQVNIERVYETSKSNQLNHFNHVDAGSILIDKFPKSIDKPRTYVQMLNRKEVAKFNSKNLIFLTYWNQSSTNAGGYGYSPVEASIPQISYHMNAEQFNARFFTQGGMTRGLLLIDPGDQGATSRASLDSLRRNLMPGQGINGSWKIPVIQASDAKYVNMTQSSKDMEFVNFLNYLNNIICAAFIIDPVEVNFPNRGGANGKGGRNTLNEGNTAKTKMDASHNKGLLPVMKFIEQIITDKILPYVGKDGEKYQFVFSPAKEGARQQQAEEIHARMQAGETINEARNELGLPPIKGADVPGDPNNYIQYLNTIAKNDPEANKQQQHINDYKPGHTDSDAKVDNNQDQSDPNDQDNVNDSQDVNN